jgi:abelson tyrosine-protein kinase 1
LRPKIPLRPETSLTLISLIKDCWSRESTSRPLFTAVARELGYLVGGASGSRMNPSPQRRVLDIILGDERERSPDMKPVDLPDVPGEC